MEPKVARPRGRPRKRRSPEDEIGTINGKSNIQTKRRAVEARSMAFVGRYVIKEFKSSGIYLGKIVYYDSGLYRVDYEDGDCEDLESGELRQLILRDNDFDDDLTVRRKKLDEFVSKKSTKNRNDPEKKLVCLENVVDRVETSTLSELSGQLTIENDGEQVEGDADSSSDSCEYARDRDSSLEAEASLVPPLQLPPSSGTIGVPEEYVSHLLSVYSFLRSFSICLFLSPFGLDDFVGSLNCCVPNTLLDAAHVALMRVLRRHLETLSSDGSEIASKCLRFIDWSLLDALTWPVYLVEYFTVMGYIKAPEWRGFYDDVLDREYHSLPAGRKLMILQILCDDVLESAELRAEIDMREESEIGTDLDVVATNPHENGPRRVHPRYSKTSACKDKEAMEIIAESHEMKSSCKSKTSGFKGTEGHADGTNVDVDRNGDECRLCGMDGTLLCCDGCPSAYHSRCIGVAKMYIPDGSWYCPECTINKMGPTIIKGTSSLRGAEILGIDLYGQVFMGTCCQLLVLKTSINSEPYLRYYSLNDIPTVLQVLFSSVQHTSLYSGICKAILQYWDIPESVLSPLETYERAIHATNRNEDAKFSTLSLPPDKERHKVLNTVESDNASSFNGSNVDNMAVSCLGITQTELPGPQSNGGAARTQDRVLKNVKLPVQIKMEPAMSTCSVSHHTDPSDLTQQSLVDRSSVIDFATCTSGNNNDSYGRHANGMCFPANMSSQSKESNHAGFGRGNRNSADCCQYMGSFFKPQAYINQYFHGDFAASAAANLAILSSEESQVSEAHKLGNARKVMSANISLQVKAFSSAASRFFWPSSEKKLVEVPRERCGWCFSCKAPASSRRACMLNAAVSSATKSAMKILNGLPSPKYGESLPTIATYILYMEESLCGLIVGPFLSATYRKKWRKQVEEASTCSAVKALLLELEENICIIALSGDWVKLTDDWLVESSAGQSASCIVGTTQKRGPSGKRHRKQFVMSEVTADGCDDKSFSWWRGGKISKLIFQKAILPRSMVRKAARQGGIRKISSINYVDGLETPKRSRQTVWRAAVEMCKNASQLALQVRCLDLHVRWSDLVHPEQNLQDGKGPETEASAFRNAIICDKRNVENRIIYGVAFGNQRHLPSRVMKNVIEVERSRDGKDKYWFSEMRIPLYLIKDYEENMCKVLLPSVKKPMNGLSELQRRQLKASRWDIFSYLTAKMDNLEKCYCASCQLDVLLRNAVKCSECQGYCHEDCTLRSLYTNEEAKLLITCKQCSNSKALAQNKISNKSPTSPLPGQECYNAVRVTKSTRLKGFNRPLASIRTRDSCSEIKQATNSILATEARSRSCSWGIIWRKRNNEDTGIDFRRVNILLRGSSDIHGLSPVCELCKKDYDSELMYIHCETCEKWYHAKALELEESRIPDVVGFKCCKCRRIGSPDCPYTDPEVLEEKRQKRLLRALKQGQGNLGVESDCRTISESKEYRPTTPIFPPEEVFVLEDDPLLLSLSKVEQIAEHNSEVDVEWNTASGPGLQKLPVRRHVKCEGDVDGFSGKLPVRRHGKCEGNVDGSSGKLPVNVHVKQEGDVDGFSGKQPVRRHMKHEDVVDGFSEKLPARKHVKLGNDVDGFSGKDSKLSMCPETNNLINSKEESSFSCAKCDVSVNGIEGEMLFDFGGLNYEDMEFEPQTYFTVTELLESDDGGQLDGFDATGNVSGNIENPSCAISWDAVPEQYETGICNEQEPMISVKSPVIDTMRCQVCSHTEPAPDLSCQICGFLIHSQCSHWDESSTCKSSWKCGSCREWR